MDLCADINKATTKTPIQPNDLLNAIELLNDNCCEGDWTFSYIHITDFVRLFPKIYDLVIYNNGKWYWLDSGTEIRLLYNKNLLTDNAIIFGKEIDMMESNDYCRRCHKKLKDEKSKALGFGKVCYEKYLRRKRRYLFKMGEDNEVIEHE